MMKNKKIAIIGLGYVGLPLAVEFGKSREVLDMTLIQREWKSFKETLMLR